jgi:hypothetical protein
MRRGKTRTLGIVQSPFYATAEDLHEVCRAVSERIQLRFDRTGSFQSETLRPATLPTIADLTPRAPHLAYLISPFDVAVSTRQVQTPDGPRFVLDELANRASATLKVGFRPNNGLLTPGSIGTTSKERRGP